MEDHFVWENQECIVVLKQCVRKLINEQVIHYSLYNKNPRFEILEFHGDKLLGYKVSKMITTKFGQMTPGQCSRILDNTVNNERLAQLYDLLDIHDLVCQHSIQFSNPKKKADVVEALLSELHRSKLHQAKLLLKLILLFLIHHTLSIFSIVTQQVIDRNYAIMSSLMYLLSNDMYNYCTFE